MWKKPFVIFGSNKKLAVTKFNTSNFHQQVALYNKNPNHPTTTLLGLQSCDDPVHRLETRN